MTFTEWYFVIGFIIACITTLICKANDDNITWYGFLIDMTLWFLVVIWLTVSLTLFFWGYNRHQR